MLYAFIQKKLVYIPIYIWRISFIKSFYALCCNVYSSGREALILYNNCKRCFFLCILVSGCYDARMLKMNICLSNKCSITCTDASVPLRTHEKLWETVKDYSIAHREWMFIVKGNNHYARRNNWNINGHKWRVVTALKSCSCFAVKTERQNLV